MKRHSVSVVFLVLFAFSARGEVVRVEVDSRSLVLGGVPFGEVGPYEKPSGRIFFSLDPSDPANAAIVDLSRAPRNEAGRVEASANFMVLRPKDLKKGSGTALLEVSNRGGKASLGYFNAARSSLNPNTEAHFGDGLVMRLGLTVIWVGWQFDVPKREGALRLVAPIAREGDRSIEGLVRCDWTVDRPTRVLELGHRNHTPYPVLDKVHPFNVLTVRDGRNAQRRIVPRKDWRFATDLRGDGGGRYSKISAEGGFEAGKIYELVYRAKDPSIVGLGLAAIRDTISYAKYHDDCPFPVERGLAVGISQTGRFLRHFLYQGFNRDEGGRKAFDGLLIHTAGAGRGSFNHRFAQPSRDAHRYSAFFYPTDIFPFTGRAQRDPVTGRREGLLDRLPARHRPKIFYTNTGYEYWGRAASLLHTSLDGSADVEPLLWERIYHLASGQHFAVGFPPSDRSRIGESPAYRGNPLDFLVTERALLVALKQWVELDRLPPPSAYPRIDAGSLVPIDEVEFPEIAGVVFPKVIHEAYRVDYGAGLQRGIITKQPPILGAVFPTLVSQVDHHGNEIGGVPTVETLVAVATYAPWHLRQGMAGGNGELTDFYGTYIPFALTEEDRERTSDPRPSLESLYDSKETYLEQANRAADELVDKRILLVEDKERVLDRAERQWDWLHR